MYRKSEGIDPLSRKAQRENYPARSIYKLEEIDRKFRILKSGDFVLDLGAAPGSWLMYIAKKVGSAGKVLGVDIQELNTDLPPNARFLKEDVFSLQIENEISKLCTYAPVHRCKDFDAVVSDMAPNTSGIRGLDEERSADLCLRALEIAKKFLKSKGNFVCKIFESSESEKVFEEIEKYFKEVKRFRPPATRSRSREMFYVGISKNPD